MIYSHKYDLIAKYLLVAIAVAPLIGFEFDTLTAQWVQQYHLKASQGNFILFLFGCIILVVLWFTLYLPILSPLASWFYVRYTLKTPITWAMAKELSPLLRPNFWTMLWMPMTSIKDLPEEMRVAALNDILNHSKNKTYV